MGKQYGSATREEAAVLIDGNISKPSSSESLRVSGADQRARSAGVMQRPDATAGIVLSGARPDGWTSYLDLSLGPVVADRLLLSSAVGGFMQLRRRDTDGFGIGAFLGALNFGGDFDGNSTNVSARIRSLATETWAAANRGANLLFDTLDNVSVVLTERMRIDQDGGVHIGATFTAPPVNGLRTEGQIIVESGGLTITGDLSLDGGLHIGSTFTTPPAGGIRTEGQIIVEAGGVDVTGLSQFRSNLDMLNNVILNIGALGTDFTATGGLGLADQLRVISGGINCIGDLDLDGDLDFVGPQEITTTTGNLTLNPAGDVVIPDDLLINTTTDQGLQELQVADSSGGEMLLWRDDSTIVTDSVLGGIQFGGDEGSDFHIGAVVSGIASQTWTGTNKGSYLWFTTTAEGTETRTERMRIAPDGGVHIGATYTAPPTGGLRTEGQIIVQSGGLTVGGDVVLSDDTTALIRLNTSNGSDSSRLVLAGGGDIGTTRGAYIAIAGNEFGGGEEGTINIFGGTDSADGGLKLWTNDTLRLDINFAGLTTLSAGLTVSTSILLTGSQANLCRITPDADSQNGVINVTNAANTVNWLTVNANGAVLMNGTGLTIGSNLILTAFSTTAVSEGAVDSGGSGFKLLRVPN